LGGLSLFTKVDNRVISLSRIKNRDTLKKNEWWHKTNNNKMSFFYYRGDKTSRMWLEDENSFSFQVKGFEEFQLFFTLCREVKATGPLPILDFKTIETSDKGVKKYWWIMLQQKEEGRGRGRALYPIQLIGCKVENTNQFRFINCCKQLCRLWNKPSSPFEGIWMVMKKMVLNNDSRDECIAFAKESRVHRLELWDCVFPLCLSHVSEAFQDCQELEIGNRVSWSTEFVQQLVRDDFMPHLTAVTRHANTE